MKATAPSPLAETYVPKFQNPGETLNPKRLPTPNLLQALGQEGIEDLCLLETATSPL